MTWLPIPGAHPYEVSDLGEIRRCGTALTQQTHRGYRRVQIWQSGKPRSLRVHRAVCEAFNGPAPTPAHEVEHLDHDKANNTPSNLRWTSHAENIARSVRDGIHVRGERNGSAILTLEAVSEIRAQAYYYGYARDLAAKFGVSPQTITAIRRGRAWGHAA